MKPYFSVKYKLILMITVTCVFVLMLTVIAFLVKDRSFIKNDIHEQFAAIARILADQNTAALSFDDNQSAQETLEAVALEQSVLNACIYNDSGNLFAGYSRSGYSKCNDSFTEQKTYFSEDYLQIFEPVMLDSKAIGSVILKISMGQVKEHFLKMLPAVAVIVLLASLISFLLARYLQGIISGPVLDLASIAKDISEKGDYNVTIKQKSNDEIGELYNAFDEMLSQIRARQKARDEEEELRRGSEAQVRLLLESTAEAIYGVDRNGKCTIVNPSCLKILGYDNKEEFLKLDAYSKLHQNPYESGNVSFQQSKISQVIQTGEGVHVDSELMYKRDGTKFYAEYWIYPIKTNTDTVGAVVTFIDITERKEVEQKLKNYQEHLEEMVDQRTEEIKLAYKELEAFSYSVSHDLRAPLRAIDGFSQMLAEDYESGLDELGKDYLTRIRNGAQKMSQLIDDLLTLSRAMRGDITREEIDLAYEAMEVMSELKASEPERVVYFEIDEDMKANADRTLMRIVIQNLLSNAWKYTSRREDAHIRFGHKTDNGEFIYYIKDDGAGFDMQYADKLFHAFQRLHQPEEFPGTGIGLATVQRIISRHGGRIWANSVPQKGATFYFTLPAKLT